MALMGAVNCCNVVTVVVVLNSLGPITLRSQTTTQSPETRGTTRYVSLHSSRRLGARLQTAQIRQVMCSSPPYFKYYQLLAQPAHDCWSAVAAGDVGKAATSPCATAACTPSAVKVQEIPFRPPSTNYALCGRQAPVVSITACTSPARPN